MIQSFFNTRGTRVHLSAQENKNHEKTNHNFN